MTTRATDEMTLVFELAALRRLAQPAAAVAEAREWSTNVGIVASGSSEPITNFVEEAGVDADFTSGTGGLAGSLAVARQRFPTERHVFVGVTDDGQRLARSLGWESLELHNAAKKAGWRMLDS
jgi:hypothetical protein